MGNAYDIEWLKGKVDAEEKVKYLFFWGHTKKSNQEVTSTCFSQWYERGFTVDDFYFQSTEHWMMAQKALLFDDTEIYKTIIAAKTPAEAKALGRRVKGFDDHLWTKERNRIVCEGNLYKFTQNEDLGEFLKNTNDRVIVESSPVDTIWGIGLTKDSEHANNVSEWRGLNLLGFALMEIRDVLNNQETV